MNFTNQSFFKKFAVMIILLTLFLFGNISIAASKTPQCLPPVQSVKVNEHVTIQASGGTGQYVWTAKEGNPSTGSGSEFTTSFSSIGRKQIVVKSGRKQTCIVNVFDANYSSSCDNNGTCSIKIIQPFKFSGRPRSSSSPVRPIDLNITTTIKDPLNFLQNGKVLTDGAIISAFKPILVADAGIPRTIESGGPSGSPDPGGPIGETEPSGPIGITEPGGPSGEWNETGGVYDTPPIDFSNQCGSKDFIPSLFASKKERGFILKMGVCAQSGNLSIEGFRCDKNVCYPPQNVLTANVKVEKTYNLKVKLIAEKGNYKDKGSEVLNFETPLIPIKISSQKKIAINSPPVNKISYKQNNSKSNSEFILSADGSYDSDKRPKSLTYNWSLLEKPSGSKAKIVDASSKDVILQPDVKGKYKVKLTISDGLDQTFNTIALDVSETSASTIQTPIDNKFSVLCNQGKICKAVLTQNSSVKINYELNASSTENTIISFYNVPKGITLKSDPPFLKPEQKMGKIIIFSSADILPGKYQSIVRFKQGSKFVEALIQIEIIQQSFPPFPPTVEILPPLSPDF